jgi:hypothetical protein
LTKQPCYTINNKSWTKKKHKQLIQAYKEKPAEIRQQEWKECNEIQRELRMEGELKEKAKQTRIGNFYKSKPGN